MSLVRPLRLIHVISGLGDGGAEAVLSRLLVNDRTNSHHVVSLSNEGKYGEMLRQAGVPVTSLGMRAGRPAPYKAMRLVRLIARKKPDAVQTWMYHADFLGGLAARLAGCRRVIWTLHNATLGPILSKRTTRMLSRINAPLSHWVPERIISCSEHGAAIHKAAGYCVDRFEIVPNGYDTENFKPDQQAGRAVRAGLGIGPDEIVLGCVARFDPHKDHASLLAAASELARDGCEFKLLLVGTGVTPDNTVLTDSIARAGLGERIHLLGQRHDVPAVMNALDLHVLTSRGEAFPNVLCEAMACGTPCVATDVGDCALIIGDAGVICPQGDARAIAAAIRRLLANSSRDALAKRARERIVERFSLGAMREGYSRVWHGGQNGYSLQAVDARHSYGTGAF